MSEEKSIFSKLKPINLGEEVPSNHSTTQNHSINVSNQDISLIKNEILAIKEKLFLFEKILEKLDKKNDKIIYENIENKIESGFNEYSKKIIETLLIEIKKEVLKEFDEKLNRVLNQQREFLDKEIKNLSNELRDVNEKIKIWMSNKEDNNVEKEIFVKMKSISDNLLKIYEKFDKKLEMIDKLLNFENKSLYSHLEFIVEGFKHLLSSIKELKDKIYSDENLKNNTFLKKYLVYFIELESDISKLNNFLSKILEDYK